MVNYQSSANQFKFLKGKLEFKFSLALLCIAAVFLFMSCKKKEEKQIQSIDYHRGNVDETIVTTEKLEDDTETEHQEIGYEGLDDYDDNLNVADVRKHLASERYQKVISMLENQRSPLSQYYRGIAYFNMSKQNSYSRSERLSYVKNAETLLLEASQSTDNDEVKARALMWLSILIHLSNTDKASKNKALEYLAEIENNLYHTSSYGDALVVKANIYRYLGQVQKAANVYYKIAKIDDEYVYDYVSGRYFSPRQASEHFLKVIWWIPEN